MTRRAAQKHNREWLNSQVNVPRKKCGLLMVAQNDEEFKTLLDYEVKAKVNGEDVRIINKCELKKLEPHLEVWLMSKNRHFSFLDKSDFSFSVRNRRGSAVFSRRVRCGSLFTSFV